MIVMIKRVFQQESAAFPDLFLLFLIHDDHDHMIKSAHQDDSD